MIFRGMKEWRSSTHTTSQEEGKGRWRRHDSGLGLQHENKQMSISVFCYESFVVS